MDVWLRITTAYPDLALILRDAARCADWNAAARLRARVRSLGMNAADQGIALGILASCLDG